MLVASEALYDGMTEDLKNLKESAPTDPQIPVLEQKVPMVKKTMQDVYRQIPFPEMKDTEYDFGVRAPKN